MEKDLIRDILERVMAEHGLTEAAALKIETEIRVAWGGERVFVAKDAKRQPHVREKIVADFAAGLDIAQIERAHGISRRTIYRMLKRK